MQHPVDCYTVLPPTEVVGKEAAVTLIREFQRGFHKSHRAPERDLRRIELPQHFRAYIYCGVVGAPVTFAPPLMPWNDDHLRPEPPTYVLPDPPLFPDLVGRDNWFWDRLRFGSHGDPVMPDADAFTEAV